MAIRPLGQISLTGNWKLFCSGFCLENHVLLSLTSNMSWNIPNMQQLSPNPLPFHMLQSETHVTCTVHDALQMYGNHVQSNKSANLRYNLFSFGLIRKILCDI